MKIPGIRLRYRGFFVSLRCSFHFEATLSLSYHDKIYLSNHLRIFSMTLGSTYSCTLCEEMEYPFF